jgi:hypothetical protein
VAQGKKTAGVMLDLHGLVPPLLKGKRVRYRGAFIVAAIASVICSGAAGTVDAAGQTWGWFAALSAIDEWFLVRGDAKVEISGTSFVAELYDSRDNGLAITLKGTIRGNRAEVVAVRHATDDKARRLTGVHKKVRWKDPPGEREAILLTEPDQPWGLTIGLTRELKQSRSPTRN